MGRRICLQEGSFGLLDEYLLVNIFNRIRDMSDRQAWCLVCKRFLALEASSRQKLQVVRGEVLPNVLRRYKDVQTLDLSLCLQLTDSSLVHVGQVLRSSLSSINLAGQAQLTDLGLAVLAKDCAMLRDIDLSHCSQISDVGLFYLAQLELLERVQLVNCRAITDAGIGFLAAGCKKLRLLNIRWCLGVTDAGISLIADNCKLLQTLDLSYTDVSAEGVQSITFIDSLKTLVLASCYKVDDACLSILKNRCKSLQDLDVGRCQHVSDRGIMELASGTLAIKHLTLSYCLPVTVELLASLQRFHSLQSIRLDGCDIASSGLFYIAKGCQRITELSLCKCTGVTDEGIQAVVAGCRDMRKLDLTCCRELTDASLSAISTCCKGLRSLKMEACGNLTHNGLKMLGEGCTALEQLDLTDCMIRDAGLKAVAKCSALISLKLAYCLITAKGLAYIGTGCPNLLELDLYRAVEVCDAGVASIVKGCRRLRTLNLSYCSEITDAALQSVSELRDLTQLDIRACWRVSCAGLASVAAACKKLIELDIKRCLNIGDAGIEVLSRECTNLREMNVSYCPITNVGLMALCKLSCLHNLKLVNMKYISDECLVAVLLELGSLKKVKLLTDLRMAMSEDVVQEMEIRGCKLRWMDKPADAMYFMSMQREREQEYFSVLGAYLGFTAMRPLSCEGEGKMS